MSWFKRIKNGINTSTKDKKKLKKELWFRCPVCKSITPIDEHKLRFKVCDCGHHCRVSTHEYFKILFDNNDYQEINHNLTSKDPLGFTDKKKYTDRLKTTQEKTKLQDAITTAYGKIEGIDIMIASMDFAFIGGSMGSVVGEKIARAIDYCIENKTPLLIISKSGGARMMEAAFSLMQMAKTAAKLTQLADAKLPYISLLTDPTTGGVTASYAMLGDVNIAEPKALIGFAGPRVIKETIGKDLPEGFQRSEFLLEHGFLDYIVHRKDLRNVLAQQLLFFQN